MTVIHIHNKGDQIAVKHSGDSIWIDIPLSDDRTADVTAFLSIAECDRIGAELLAVANRAKRIAAIHRGEQLADQEPVSDAGIPSVHEESTASLIGDDMEEVVL